MILFTNATFCNIALNKTLISFRPDILLWAMAWRAMEGLAQLNLDVAKLVTILSAKTKPPQ